MVMLFEVTVGVLAQVELEVKTNITTSPFDKVEVL
jgi:hypothetical protein